MKLNYKRLGQGKPLVILHGVFGSLDNWFTLGKEFSAEFDTLLVDLRNHGQSPHSDEFDYQVMAEDVVELIDDLKLGSAYVLGHSMGGKVAMQLACTEPGMVDRLIVVDIGPKKYPPHHQNIYDGFRSIDLDQINTRGEADSLLSKTIPEPSVRQFILKNLDRTAEGFKWKLNLDAIEKNAALIGAPLLETESFSNPTLFIGGANSKYILEDDHSGIQHHFPSSKIVMIDGAGHWVHAEKPKELYANVLDFLAS